MRSQSPDLDWVASILAAPPLILTVGRGQSSHARETFAVLPTAARPRFVVSLASRRAAAAAIGDSSYAPELQVRLARAVSRLGITLGIAEHVFRDRLSITESDSEPEQPLSDVLLSARAAEIFERDDLTIAVRVGAPRPNRKPLVRVLSHDGAFVGYVKIGWNTLTRELVRNEARILAEIDRLRSSLTALEVPRVVYAGKWRQFELLALTPLRGRPLRPVRRHLDVAAAAMNEISHFARDEERHLADSDYWRATKARIEGVANGAPLARLADTIEKRCGSEVYAFGSWHGDWAPWNMALRDRRVAVWDWERSTNNAPAGLDAAHFDFQVALATSRNRSIPALETVLAGNAPMLSGLALPRPPQRTLLALHLLEMGLRWENGRRAGMSPPDVVYVPALEALLQGDH